ncbi:MAG: hypothetical protein HQL98_01430 [Magnetococcales bacterium]|nr:hypothetical protein [Magnetococcales bacterium]
MDISNRSQQGGDNSLNIQAEQVTVNTGLTISHVREIANEVFESNFAKLAGLAKETADKRAREITDQFIQELEAKNPAGMQAAEDPDFQYSLFTVQKEFARCGDKELGDLLVGLLVDRTKQEERSLLQIVLNESLSVAPKLNSEQLDILACCFNVANVFRGNMNSIEMLADYLENEILVFADPISLKLSNYKHIEFVGCASVRAGSRDIVKSLTDAYKGFFSKGYQRDAIRAIEEREPKIIDVHISCLHDSALLQPKGLNDDITKTLCSDRGISEELANQLIQLNTQYVMNEQEARKFLEKICPRFPKFLDDAASTQFNSMELTSVGIAIAHAHSRKKIGFDADLSIWI